MSSEQKEHIETCKSCQAFRSEEKQLSQMISGLPKVGAPKDFEFGFRSKLAESSPKVMLTPVWQTLRYALPLTAAVLIFGFVIANSSLFSVDERTPKLADSKSFSPTDETSPIPELKDSAPQVDLIADKSVEPKVEEAPKVSEKPQVDEKIQPKKEIAESKLPIKNKGKKDEILSRDIKPESDSQPKILNRDSAATEGKPINPKGIQPDKPIVNPRVNETAKTFTAKEVLAQLGISTSGGNGRLRVTNVGNNSAGFYSGVKTGDLVTAIDGEKLSGKPLSVRSIKGGTLTVIRQSKQITITIKNR